MLVMLTSIVAFVPLNVLLTSEMMVFIVPNLAHMVEVQVMLFGINLNANMITNKDVKNMVLCGIQNAIKIIML